MSRAEFELWRDKFEREPWGVVAADRRHSEQCSLLLGVINSWASKPIKLKPESFYLSSTASAVKDLKELLYVKAIECKPWFDGRSQEELALEGQAHFNQLAIRYGRK